MLIDEARHRPSYWDSLPRDGNITRLDTRIVGEYSRGHAVGFINI